jgi:uncharacterized protein with HEPN domain
MRASKGDEIRLQHIADAIFEVENYTRVASLESFINDSMMKFAVVKQLEIIGETANHLRSAMRKETQNIDWRKIIGMRNIFVHEYFGIDDKLVWDIVHNDLPVLKKAAEQLL